MSEQLHELVNGWLDQTIDAPELAARSKRNCSSPQRPAGNSGRWQHCTVLRWKRFG